MQLQYFFAVTETVSVVTIIDERDKKRYMSLLLFLLMLHDNCFGGHLV